MGFAVISARKRLLLALSFSLALALSARSSNAQRNFHPRTIAQITAESPANWKHPLTHIQVSGWVTYVVKEGDGDLHVRLCDSAKLKSMDVARCIVAEIIPELTPKGYFKLKVGQHISVDGIYRYDGENPGHHWHECHPVTEMAEIVSP